MDEFDDLPSADIYADRVSADEVYMEGHFRMVFDAYAIFEIRKTYDEVLAPWTDLAMMADLDTIGLAATGALPSELVN